MITAKVSWEDVRKLIETQTGPIRTATPISEGRNSEISVIVRTDDDEFFVKGRHADHPQAWTQAREKAVNPSVRYIAPALKWSVEDAGWNLLGFEYLRGERANYSPGSKDLPKIVRTLRALQQIPCPDGVELKRAEDRWAAYTDKADLFAGDHLLHTDWTPGNVLINDRAYLVDWAWPTRGAGWIDPACWVVWLIAEGHEPHVAEEWGALVPSWDTAPPDGLEEFARVQAAMWEGIAAESSEPWTRQVARAARLWAMHRGG